MVGFQFSLDIPEDSQQDSDQQQEDQFQFELPEEELEDKQETVDPEEVDPSQPRFGQSDPESTLSTTLKGGEIVATGQESREQFARQRAQEIQENQFRFELPDVDGDQEEDREFNFAVGGDREDRTDGRQDQKQEQQQGTTLQDKLEQLRERREELREEVQKDRPTTFGESVRDFVKNKNPVIKKQDGDIVRPKTAMGFARALQKSPRPIEQKQGLKLEQKLLQQAVTEPQRQAQKARKRNQQLLELTERRIQNLRKRGQQQAQFQQEAKEQRRKRLRKLEEEFRDRLGELDPSQIKPETIKRQRQEFISRLSPGSKVERARANLAFSNILESAKGEIQSAEVEEQIDLSQERRQKQQQFIDAVQERVKSGKPIRPETRERFERITGTLPAGPGDVESDQERRTAVAQENARAVFDRLSQQGVNIEKGQSGRIINVQAGTDPVRMTPNELGKVGIAVEEVREEFDLSRDAARNLVANHIASNGEVIRNIENEQAKSIVQDIEGGDFMEKVEEKAREIVDDGKRIIDNKIEENVIPVINKFSGGVSEKIVGPNSDFEKAYTRLDTMINQVAQTGQIDLKKWENFFDEFGDNREEVVGTIQSEAQEMADNFHDLKKKLRGEADGHWLGYLVPLPDNSAAKELSESFKNFGADVLSVISGEDVQTQDQQEEMLADLAEAKEKIMQAVASGKKPELSEAEKRRLQKFVQDPNELLNGLKLKVLRNAAGPVLQSDTIKGMEEVADQVPGKTVFQRQRPENDRRVNDISFERRMKLNPKGFNKMLSDIGISGKARQIAKNVYQQTLWSDGALFKSIQEQRKRGGQRVRIPVPGPNAQVQTEGSQPNRELIKPSDSHYIRANKNLIRRLTNTFQRIQEGTLESGTVRANITSDLRKVIEELTNDMVMSAEDIRRRFPQEKEDALNEILKETTN